MNKILLGMLVVAMSGCAASGAKRNATAEQIAGELDRAAQERVVPAQPDAVSQALLPPLKVEMPDAGAKALEPKFDLVVNGAPAAQVFMGIVAGTRYSMLVHPEVSGNISVNLKDVTVLESLEAIRDLYGYDYRLDGTRIYIQPLTIQTHLFQVNYLSGERKGTSGIRVTSSSVSDNASASTSGTASTTTQPITSAATRSFESSHITTTSSTDFWEELSRALNAIVGSSNGRSVVVNPHSGMVVVRAMPDELRNVATYLKASQIAVERQVMLEAKIIEVRLSDGYQAGINWAAFKTGPGSRVSAGLLGQGATLQPGDVTTVPMGGAALTASPFGTAGVTPGTDISSLATATGGLFGLAFQTSSFAALISFLESQGTVHVLSSPRIATLNNQKAVLKVGTDEFFITNVSTTTTTGTATTSTPTLTLQPFFSGIALDVMPRIDENNNIILHVHPSVSVVAEKSKNIDLGAAGKYTLPLASSDVSETDSIVRAQNGQIVAIGGLMRQSQTNSRSQVPGVGSMPGVGALFGQTSEVGEKRELVILLKPTVIQGDRDWAENILETRDRLQRMERGGKP
ncbi:MAG: pilus (MSHA type) biogenesis protein MshL [Pseudomonadota bacterium]